jgi:hypothetical protein
VELARRDFLRSAAALSAAGWLGVGCSSDDSSSGSASTSTSTTTAAAGPTTTTTAPGVEGPGPATTALMDGLWDEGESLIGFPFNASAPGQVRETTWYAHGLLARDGDGDLERAKAGLRSVIDRQYVQPGAIFHGSYPRTAADPAVPPDGVEFVDFDPNWRQFIGTALAMAVLRHGDRLGPLRADLERSIDLAARGERPDRIQPDSTNIAVLQAWLLAHTGDVAGGEQLADAIAALHDQAGAFDEYNSPTYDGVTLYGLSLWAFEPPSDHFEELGRDLHGALWRSIAATYHPGLANACGPYARAYGMDLPTYASLTGLWIWSVVGQEAAPFPRLDAPFDHPGDACFGPLVDLFGPNAGDDVVAQLESFSGEHQVSVGVDGDWTATSWLGEAAMVGGWSGEPVRYGTDQLHAGTIHWADGWIRVMGDVDGVAGPNRLDLTVGPSQEATMTVHGRGVTLAALDGTEWHLGEVTIRVEGPTFSVSVPTDDPGAVDEERDVDIPIAGQLSLVITA